MTIPLSKIAELVAGRLIGDADLIIVGAATLSTARPGEITLADHSKHAAALARSQASAVLVPPSYEPTGIPCIVVDNVHEAFSKVVRHFHPPRESRPPGISAAAHVSLSARLGTNVQIYPQAYIGDWVEIGDNTVIHPGVRILDGCKIGRDVTLYPNVVLYENTQIGDRVVVHGGAVLGAYGFGYSQSNGRHIVSAQLGFVEVGDDVEIGAGTTIDRGTYGPTLIGSGTKIDNQVQIAHNCRIGRHNLLCSQVGIAGSATTGDYVVIGGQAGVRDHTTIGDHAMLGAQSGVMNDIAAAKRIVGSPGIDEKEQYLVWAAMYKLPEMRKKLVELQREVARLSAAKLHPADVDGPEGEQTRQQDAA